jgi:hypothetical protein
MNRLSLQRVLPADEAVTVELLVDDHLILLDVARSGETFAVRFNEIPRGIVVDLNELLELLNRSRAWLIAAESESDD